MGLTGFVLALCAVAFGQPAANDDPVEVLMRLRDQVLEHGRRIPKHTCVETIQRDRYEPVRGHASKSCDAILAKRQQADLHMLLRLDTTDRLRLDVALTVDREIYSWAGANHFEEADLDEWIPQGAIGTGPFASMLLGVFESHDPRFLFEGESAIDGRRLLEYSFIMPKESSHYRVKADREWIITGYTGTLLVDPHTAELVRFTVRTEELPEPVPPCEIDSTLRYGLVPIGGIDYLLPMETRVRYIGRDGTEAENLVSFSSCREFRGESALEFGETSHAAASAPDSAPAPFRLPGGLPMTVDITSTIDCEHAAAGDRIEGRLVKTLQDPGQKTTLVKEGALLEGRLMRVETRQSTPTEVTIALRWETMEVNGVKVPVLLVPNRRLGDLKSVARSGLRTRGVQIELPAPNEGRYGIYHFPGERPIVKSGFRTEWSTAAP